MGSLVLIEKAKKFGLLQYEYSEKQGMRLVKVKAMNPVTGEKLSRSASAKDEELLRKKIEKIELDVYEKYRSSYLCVFLQTGDKILLAHYLTLDFEYCQSVWPKSYRAKKYETLFHFAEIFDRDLCDCKTAEDFLPAIASLQLDQSKKLVLLRMLSDIAENLIHVGLLDGPNPLRKYYDEGQRIANRKKNEKAEPDGRSLSTGEIGELMRNYGVKTLFMPLYHVILLVMLGLSVDQVAALNLEDAVVMDDTMCLTVKFRMVKGKRRWKREEIKKSCQIRILTVPWMDGYIVSRIDACTRAENECVKKIPLFSPGVGNSVKRYKPEDLKEFIMSAMEDVVKLAEPEVRPNPRMEELQSFRMKNDKVTIGSLRNTFLICGERSLNKNTFLCRYILGKEPQTVDEKNYLDYIHPFSIKEMSDMVRDAFLEMGMEMNCDEL